MVCACSSDCSPAFVVDMAPDQNVPVILAIAIAIDEIGRAER